MKKSIILLLLSTMLFATLLTGCKKEDPAEKDSTEVSENPSISPVSEDGTLEPISEIEASEEEAWENTISPAEDVIPEDYPDRVIITGWGWFVDKGGREEAQELLPGAMTSYLNEWLPGDEIYNAYFMENKRFIDDTIGQGFFVYIDELELEVHCEYDIVKKGYYFFSDLNPDGKQHKE